MSKTPSKNSNLRIIRSDDVVDPRDKKSIIELWSDSRINTNYKTRYCRLVFCDTKDCIYSHHKIGNYPIVRCNYCSDYNCGKDTMIYRNIGLLNGKEIVIVYICRRVGWELQDADSKPENKSISIETLQKKPKIEREVMGKEVIGKEVIGKEDREHLKASLGKIDDSKSIIKRKSKEDGGLTVYYFRSTPATKKALVRLVSDDGFKGQVKISEPHLQKAISKFPDEDIVAMKAELAELPGADVIIDRAELRLQNAYLQKLLGALKPK
jgi:hypothetical protein